MTSEHQSVTFKAGKFAGGFSMSLAEAKPIAFFPSAGPPAGAAKLGFRFGDKGTHSSRTLMLAELGAVLAAAPGPMGRAAYAAAIIEGNCLEKPTASTRRISNQRLAELYALDPFVVIFRVLRKLWDVDAQARPLLATLEVGPDGELAFAAPPLLRGGSLDAADLAAAVDALGIEPGAVVDSAWVDNGPGWMAILLGSADEVLAIRPKPTDLKIGVVGPHPAGARHAYEVRAFFSENGATFEDPVTGSLNASVAQWLIGSGRFAAPYLASQGAALGRAGEVAISCDVSGAVWVGGAVVTCIAGRVRL